MALLLELVHEQGLAAVVATHDPSLVGLADEVLDLRDGRLDAPAPGVQGSGAQHA
jgi:putative ABC transport system ATP-binding protein